MAKDKGLSFGCVSIIGLVGVVLIPLALVPTLVAWLVPGADWRPDLPWGMFVVAAVAMFFLSSALDKAVTALAAPLPGPWWLHELIERGVEALVGALILYLLITPFWAAFLCAMILEVVGAVAEPWMDRLEEDAH